jgi:uncharacterized protein YbaP (TraB family)
MKTPRLAFAGLVMLFALTVLQPIPVHSGEAAAPARHSLWKVEGASNEVYILGSVHLLKKEHYPLATPIESAFTNSRIAVFEADMGEMQNPEVQMRMMSKSMLPAGETLKGQLSADVYEAFAKRLEQNGLPAEVFDRFKPSMAAMMLSVMELLKTCADPEYGVDKHFHGRAMKEGKEIVPLETVDFQISMFTDMCKAEGELLLKTTLKDIDKTQRFYGEIITAWQTGDAAAVEKLLNEAIIESPEIYKRMLTDRNRQWLPKIEQFLRSNRNTIVIVGAGHLVGKDSVLALLEAKGFKVTQL